MATHPLASPDLDRDLLAFIDASVPSVWALELLVLLRRSPDDIWTAERLVLELRASSPLVADLLIALQRSGLVIQQGEGFQYRPVSAVLNRLCDALEAAYRERPVAVIRAITRRQSSPLTGFADSFRVRGWRP